MTAERFKEIVVPMKEAMMRIAFNIVGSESDALDAIQDSLITLWNNRQRLAEASNPEAYCIIALKNRCLSILRSRRETTSLETFDNASDGDAVSREIDARDSLCLMRSIIDSLPEGQRKVVRLSIFGQCTNEEIAALTGYSGQNVRTLLSRGRRRIKELFILHSPIL